MIERYSENFAAGYWECTGADSSSILYLGIGTNTSVPSVVTTSAGATWAGTVNSVSNYNESDHASQQVVIRGANDIEPAWVSQASAINWVNGYQNAGGPLYEDFGSCDGCPTIATTGNGYPFGPCSGCSNWNQYGAWYVSWGASDALIIPEIYYYNQQGGWAGLSYYSVLAHGGRIYFDGPMDEYDMPNAGGSYTQASSWSVFWNVLQGFGGAIAMTPKFALEQHQTNS